MERGKESEGGMSKQEEAAMNKQPTVAEVHAWMRSFIAPIAIGAVNGVLRSMPQIPVEEVMVMICRLFGEAVGGTLCAGDLGPILQLRAKCKEAFTEGMGKVPIRSMAAQPNDQDLLHKVTRGSA